MKNKEVKVSGSVIKALNAGDYSLRQREGGGTYLHLQAMIPAEILDKDAPPEAELRIVFNISPNDTFKLAGRWDQHLIAKYLATKELIIESKPMTGNYEGLDYSYYRAKVYDKDSGWKRVNE